MKKIYKFQYKKQLKFKFKVKGNLKIINNLITL